MIRLSLYMDMEVGNVSLSPMDMLYYAKTMPTLPTPFIETNNRQAHFRVGCLSFLTVLNVADKRFG